MALYLSKMATTMVGPIRTHNKVWKGPTKNQTSSPHWLSTHARLKNEFTEDEKCHNLMTWLKF